MDWQDELSLLDEIRTLGRGMGGPEAVSLQHSQGKLTVRERVDLLVDPASFQEIRSTYGLTEYDQDGRLVSFHPAPTVVGRGLIGGRPVYLRADDCTVSGGAPEQRGYEKRKIDETAGYRRAPLIKLLDGADANASEATAATRSDDRPPRETAETVVSVREAGVVGSLDVSPTYSSGGSASLPGDARATMLADGNLLAQVPVAAAVLGPCEGWKSIDALDAHFSVMTKETGSLSVAGPSEVKRALGMEITTQELGDWRVQAEFTGTIKNVADDEGDAFQQIRQFLSYLPQSVWQLPVRTPPEDDPNRRADSLLSIIPRERRRSYDVRQLIELVVDRDSTFEMSALFGRSLVTMLARVDGFPVAIIANDCRYDGGALTPSACQKFERFVDLADTFHLPVIYFCDVPGFMLGPAAESAGILRWAVLANTAVEEATTPYCTILLRRFYGVAVESRKAGPGLNPVYAWPSAVAGGLPAAGGVMAAYRREIEEAPDPDAKRVELEAQLDALASVLRQPRIADEIIDPRASRPVLVEFVRSAYEVNATQLGPKIRLGMRP